MHLQSENVPGWDRHVLRLRRGAVIKEIDRGDLARHVKRLLAAAGRPLDDFLTLHRHMGFTTFNGGTWAQAKDHMRAQIEKTVDATFLLEYMETAEHPAFIDRLNGANEFWSDTTPTDPDRGEKYLLGEEAFSSIWNEEYRGTTRGVWDERTRRWVDVRIPETLKLALWAGTVANRIPARIMRLANNDDQALDYHAYDRYVNGERQADSWQNHAGLWNTQEQETGIRVREWLFGEAGPYFNTADGWRADTCLGAVDYQTRLGRLAAAWRRLLTNFQATAAYREGRASPPVWYTIGSSDWPLYEYDEAALSVTTDVFAELWHPGEYRPMSITTMIVENVPESVKAAYIDHIAAMTEHVNAGNAPYPYGPPAPAWWDRPTPYVFRAQNVNPLRLYADDRATVVANLNYSGWEIQVFAVDLAGWLKVVDPAGTAGDRWLRASDLTLLP